ncbi:porphobilinogen deaminase, dipyromethane cofactor binding domain-containing protein [Cryomyces antarcticus]
MPDPPTPLPPSSTTASTSPAADLPTINIGTRRSLLARIQTGIVEKALKKAHPERRYEIHAMSTMGDKNQVTPLHDFGAKALWTHELEALLLEGKLDLVVHSLKDMPTQLPPSLTIGSIFAREDPRDALVVSPSLASTHRTLASLPAGSIIGTSSVRRSAQLKRLYPHLRFADVRGNVGTRLAKLDSPPPEGPHYAALILAAAGLLRLGLGERITALLSKRDGGMLHAVGQGALGIEIREADDETRRILAKVGDERTARACLAERSLMRTLEGGCSVPIGVETEWVRRDENENDDAPLTHDLTMRAIVVSLDGSEAVEAELTRPVASREAADELGWAVAAALVDRGAGRILQAINLNRAIVEAGGDA